MSTTKHTILRRKVVKIFKQEGCDWIYCPRDQYTKNIPDILTLLNGIFYAIEIKIDYDKVRPLQLKTLENINKGGGVALVIRKIKNKTTIEVIGGVK